jgi:hypothetical protein
MFRSAYLVPMSISMNVWDRLRDGGLTGLIGGKQTRRTKLIGVGVALLIFYAVRIAAGIVAGFAAVIIYAALAGLVLRLRERAAGPSLDSTEY